MKNLIWVLLFLASTAFGRVSNQVYRMPATGNVPTWGAIDLSQTSVAVQNVLNILNGGTGVASTPVVDNFLYNAGFDLAQRFNTPSSISVTAANTVIAYGPDRWFAQNSLGAGAVITEQTASVFNSPDPAAQAVKVSVTTAPTTAVNTGPYFCQTLEGNEGNSTTVQDTLRLNGQTASLSALVKATGNVTQVTAYILLSGFTGLHATYPGRSGVSTIGSHATTVNTSTATAVSVTNVSMGNVGSAGIGLCFAPTAVSTGHISDVGNGLIVEQPMFNIGTSVGPWKRKMNSAAAELSAAQRYYELNSEVVVGSGATAGLVFVNWAAYSTSTTGCVTTVTYKVPKGDNGPTVTIAAQTNLSGTLGEITWLDFGVMATTLAASITSNTNQYFTAATSSGCPSSTNVAEFFWSAESEAY